jgi:CRISPR-associated protein Cas5t
VSKNGFNGVKMKAVRFIAEGLINSFRMPQTSVFQLTYLAPTKTQVAGFLANIMGKTEEEYYQLLDDIKVGIVPLYIESIFNDAWTFKKWKASGAGRDILQREKIYRGKFLIYTSAEEPLLGDIMKFLRYPSRIPSLGMDDELVLIRDIKKIEMEPKDDSVVHSVFTYNEGMKYEYCPKGDNVPLFPPRIITVNLNFDRKVTPRKPTDFVQVVESLGFEFDVRENKRVHLDREYAYNVEMI